MARVMALSDNASQHACPCPQCQMLTILTLSFKAGFAKVTNFIFQKTSLFTLPSMRAPRRRALLRGCGGPAPPRTPHHATPAPRHAPRAARHAAPPYGQLPHACSYSAVRSTPAMSSLARSHAMG